MPNFTKKNSNFYYSLLDGRQVVTAVPFIICVDAKA